MEVPSVEGLPVDDEVDTFVVAALAVVDFPVEALVETLVEDVAGAEELFPELKVVETLLTLVIEVLLVLTLLGALLVL